MENINENNEHFQFESRLDLKPLFEQVQRIKTELGKVIIGQHQMIDQLIVGILVNGHVLLEGVPGVAKTLTAKLLSKTLALDYSRIQFTPDLMPSDILGTSVFDLKKSEFDFKKGPIFSNIVLIDEINRAPAKTQAALFEVMEERQITIDNNFFEMDQPFLVIATQNPVEQEGTYRLPEAQLDRFLFKITIDYPTLADEIKIVNRENDFKSTVKTSIIESFIAKNDLLNFQKIINDILIESHLIEYIAKIVHQTREHAFIYLGASPRASIAILKASKGFAAIEGRDFVTPEDIKRATLPVLRHRIIVSPEREMEGLTSEQIINQIIESLDIPR